MLKKNIVIIGEGWCVEKRGFFTYLFNVQSNTDEVFIAPKHHLLLGLGNTSPPFFFPMHNFFIISCFPLKEKMAILWLIPGFVAPCLYWNSVDLLCFVFPNTVYLGLLHYYSQCFIYCVYCATMTFPKVVTCSSLSTNPSVNHAPNTQKNVNDNLFSSHVN